MPKRNPGLKLANAFSVNPVYSLDGPGATEAAHDRRTDGVIAAIPTTGEAFFGGTLWRGHRAMRVSVRNWQTSDQDVERVLKRSQAF